MGSISHYITVKRSLKYLWICQAYSPAMLTNHFADISKTMIHTHYRGAGIHSQWNSAEHSWHTMCVLNRVWRTGSTATSVWLQCMNFTYSKEEMCLRGKEGGWERRGGGREGDGTRGWEGECEGGMVQYVSYSFVIADVYMYTLNSPATCLHWQYT